MSADNKTDLKSLISSSVTLISRGGITLDEQSLFLPAVSGSISYDSTWNRKQMCLHFLCAYDINKGAKCQNILVKSAVPTDLHIHLLWLYQMEAMLLVLPARSPSRRTLSCAACWSTSTRRFPETANGKKHIANVQLLHKGTKLWWPDWTSITNKTLVI